VGDVLQRYHLDLSGLRRTKWIWQPVKNNFLPEGKKIMSDKLISIEEQEGPFKMVLQRVLRMVPDRDKHDKKLQRLIAFRLKIDGEAAISEYLLKKIREAIRCSYKGSLYDYLKDDLESRECEEANLDNPPPGAA
jgi:hypothetical protein